MAAEPMTTDELEYIRSGLYVASASNRDLERLLDEVDRLKEVCNGWGNNYQSWVDATKKTEGERDALAARLGIVHRFVDGRREVITALRNCPAGDPNGDYGRWTGDAQARRILAEDLGIVLDPETGGIRRDIEDKT